MKIELTDLRNDTIKWCMENKTGKERLVILSAGEDSASEIYMRNKINLGKELGIPTLHILCNTEEDLKDKIEECNDIDMITGVIVQLPLPKEWDSDYFINLISPNKDIDMLTKTNKAIMFNGDTSLLPATSTGVMKLLDERYGDTLQGKDALLIGRSSLVNIPLFNKLLSRNCTVQVAHSKTRNLSDKIANSDIVISAAGVPNLIKECDITPKVDLIVDVSINRIDGKICGDVCSDLYDIVDVTANPKGIGTLTVPMLFVNLIKMTKGEIK